MSMIGKLRGARAGWRLVAVAGESAMPTLGVEGGGSVGTETDTGTADDQFYSLEKVADYVYGTSMAMALTRVPVVFQITSLIVDSLLEGMFREQRRDRMDDIEKWVDVPDSQIVPMLNKPSDIVNADLFWTVVMRTLIENGNSYCTIGRNNGDFDGLQRVEATPLLLGSGARYGMFQDVKYTVNSRAAEGYNAADMLVFNGPGFNPNVMSSPSPFKDVAKRVIKMLESAENLQIKHFRRGPLANLFFKLADRLMTGQSGRGGNQKAREELALALSDEEGDGPLALEDWDAVQISELDLQLDQILDWVVRDVIRTLKIHPFMVGGDSEGLDVNDHFEMFERIAVRPWARRVGSELTFKLIGNGMDRRIILDTSRISLGTLRSRVEIAGLQVQGALRTPNELRADDGFRAKPGGDDLLFPVGGAKVTMREGEGNENDPVKGRPQDPNRRAAPR
ncbi:phage portal protein [Candidatus Poriferisodalis sp.]|uniref:phage portal protein n=1 Tax=Candidatus Poriferisodalis sp. TaxID=3101277 RepID=UPI003B027603